MNDTDIKEILEAIYGESIPEGAVSLIHEMRKRMAAFGPYEATRKDVVMCALMFDLYLKAKNVVKRGRPPKEESSKGEDNG